jgi:hypothetical protein
MTTKIYCVIMSLVEISAVKSILYWRESLNLCWYFTCILSDLGEIQRKRSAYNAAEYALRE